MVESLEHLLKMSHLNNYQLHLQSYCHHNFDCLHYFRNSNTIGYTNVVILSNLIPFHFIVHAVIIIDIRVILLIVFIKFVIMSVRIIVWCLRLFFMFRFIFVFTMIVRRVAIILITTILIGL